MDLEPYVKQVQQQLIAAAGLGGEPAQLAATALAAAAGPAVHLALLKALSDAVEEISAQLDDVTVNAYLDGEDIHLELTRAEGPPEAPLDDGDASARVSLRLSESLKTQVEIAARAESISVNTWLVRAASAALGRKPPVRSTHSTHRITGWVNG